MPESLDLWTLNKDCTKCSLRKGCSQVVTGCGPIQSPLLIVGEAPGQDEDLEGEPFVGRSGQLLRKLLKAAGINYKDVYITNTVKCRPPANRTPNVDEVKICKIWLWKEIQLSKAKVILPLGAVAIGLLLKINNFRMKDIVGKSFQVDYTTAELMPWYHPSYILRRNTAGEQQDMKLLDQTINWFKVIKGKAWI
jgi:uracil-DNA glycosylase family 4